MLLTLFNTELIFIDWKCDGRNNFMEFMKIIRITLKESGSSLWSQPIEQYPTSRLMQTCGKLALWPRRCKMRSKTKWEQAKQGKTKDSLYSLGIEGGHKMMRESWTNAPFSCLALRIFQTFWDFNIQFRPSWLSTLGKPSWEKSAVFLNIVQKALDPPPLYLNIFPILQGVFEHHVVNFLKSVFEH